MKPMKPGPCRIMLRWTESSPDGGRTPHPVKGDWLKSKKTAYLVIEARITKYHLNESIVTVAIQALRFAIGDIPADAVVHNFTWDPRGKKR